MVANAWLEGTYTELFPHVTRDAAGMGRLFRQFSFPGGIPSHCGGRDARLHPRGRRARLLAQPCLRRGLRQPRPAWWPAWSATARPRPDRRPPAGTPTSSSTPAGRRGAADPAPERLQDRRAHDARPHPGGRAARPLLRATATTRWWSRGASTTRTTWRCTVGWPRPSTPPWPRSTRSGTHARSGGWTGRPRWPMLDPADAQGLDRAQDGRRSQDRGDLPGPSDPRSRRPGQPRAPRRPRRLAPQLPPRGALRPRRAAGRGDPAVRSPRGTAG